MSFLRIAAVILGLGAVPVLFASAETLSSRVRDAERHAGFSISDEAVARLSPGSSSRRLAQSTVIDRELGGLTRDRSAAPTFGRIVINPSGASHFEGRSAPGSEVSLTIDTRPLGTARADTSGVWRLSVNAPLTAGDHTISSSSKFGETQRDLPGQDVRIAIPDAFSGSAVIAYEAPPATSSAPTPADPPAGRDELRSRAEDLAAAASQRFTEVIEPVKPRQTAQAPSSPSATPPHSAAPSSRPQASQSPSSGKPGPAGSANNERFAAPVVDWLERSAREYQRTIITRLSAPSGGGATVATASPPRPSASAAPRSTVAPVGDFVTDAQIGLQEWLARANRTYQTEVVRKLELPAAGTAVSAPASKPVVKPEEIKPPTPVAGRLAATDDEATEAEAQKRRADDVKRQADDRSRADAAKRAAEDADRRAAPKPIEQVVPLAPPPVSTQAAADDDARRKQHAAEEAAAAKEAAAAQAKSVEAKRQNDEAAKRQAEEARKAAEAAAAKRRDDDAKRLAEKKAADDARETAERARAAKPTAPQAEGDTAAKAANIARKAVEAARTGPAQRALDQPPAPAPRPKDERIAEGSGETGPVDRPRASQRGPAERTGRAAVAGDAVPAGGDRTGRTAAVQSTLGRACARGGRDIRPPGTYVIGPGDTLSEIAERHYGSARRMWRIVKSNRRKLRDPDFIRICQRIWLP